MRIEFSLIQIDRNSIPVDNFVENSILIDNFVENSILIFYLNWNTPKTKLHCLPLLHSKMDLQSTLIWELLCKEMIVKDEWMRAAMSEDTLVMELLVGRIGRLWVSWVMSGLVGRFQAISSGASIRGGSIIGE